MRSTVTLLISTKQTLAIAVNVTSQELLKEVSQLVLQVLACQHWVTPCDGWIHEPRAGILRHNIQSTPHSLLSLPRYDCPSFSISTASLTMSSTISFAGLISPMTAAT